MMNSSPKFKTGSDKRDRVLQLPVPEISAPASWPTLNERALHGLAGDAVRLACQNSEADPAAVLMQFLTYFGATVGNDAYVPVADAQHYARTFIVVAGQTAHARKGTSLQPVERFFNAAEAVAKQRGYPVEPLRVHRGGVGSGEGIVYAVRDPSEDTNNEGESSDPGVDDKRLLVLDEEIAGTFRAGSRPGSTASQTMRQCWDTGTLGSLTKHTPTHATNAHIAIIGHVTLPELKGTLENVEIFNGFANRFIWVCARRQKRVSWPDPMPDDQVAEIAARLADAVRFGMDVGRVTLSKDARYLWDEVYDELTEDDEDRIIAAVSARAEAQVVRLALIYALLDQSDTIQKEHVAAAVAAWNYGSESAKFIFESGAGEPETHRKIREFLMDGPKTLTDINHLFNGRSTSKYKDALKELQGAGVIRPIKGDSKNGGRPPTCYVLAEKAEKAEKQC